MAEKHSKKSRTLDMYVRLSEGKTINKAEAAAYYGVDERSIQRDIDDIRAFLDERVVADTTDHRSIVYDRFKKGFVMRGYESSLMTNSEILAVSKILLESRAFTKNEMESVLNKMVAGCVPQKNMKVVTDLLANEKYHYEELSHGRNLQELIWELGLDIKKLRRIEITYQKQDKRQGEKSYLVESAGLMFSQFYFYLNGYIVERLESGKCVRKYEYPAVFRVDRILERKETGETFHVAYGNRFEEGEFRKRIQFMYAGKLNRIQFCYTGQSLESILDRLPTAKVISESENGTIIEAEVYGKGILMWLLSQGSMVEVLKPESVRAEMKQMLLKMLERY